MQTNPGNPEYPMGTVMFYGPDNRLAIKLVASVFIRSGEEPAHLDRWITHVGDVRNDLVIAEEVATFLKKHGVKKTITMDRITGCPHEEGVDYPNGGNCPHCPFWSTVDRFTHEPVLPADTLSPEELMIALAGPLDGPPMDVFSAVEAKREAVTPLFLQAVEVVLGPLIARTERQETLFAHAIYFLAKWREAKAYPLFIRWIASSQADYELDWEPLEEMKMQDGARLLAAVCGGDLKPIKELIENKYVDELNRSLGVTTLAILVARGEVDRQTVIDYFVELATVKLERQSNFVWWELASIMGDIEAWELEPHVRNAFADDLVDPAHIDLDLIEQSMGLPPGVNLEDFRLQYPPINDVLERTDLRVIYGPGEDSEPFFGDPEFSNPLPPSFAPSDWLPPQPFIAPPKIGRNDPCPCGSGKKYKKCCGG